MSNDNVISSTIEFETPGAVMQPESSNNNKNSDKNYDEDIVMSNQNINNNNKNNENSDEYEQEDDNGMNLDDWVDDGSDGSDGWAVDSDEFEENEQNNQKNTKNTQNTQNSSINTQHSNTTLSPGEQIGEIASGGESGNESDRIPDEFLKDPIALESFLEAKRKSKKPKYSKKRNHKRKRKNNNNNNNNNIYLSDSDIYSSSNSDGGDGGDGGGSSSSDELEREGVSTKYQPDTGGALKRQKCYICSACDAINSLLDTFRREFRCINPCGSSYDPKHSVVMYSAYPQTEPFDEGIINNDNNNSLNNDNNDNNNNDGNGYDISQFEDAPINTELECYEIWTCPQCSHKNSIIWPICVLDHCRFDFASAPFVIETEYMMQVPSNPLKELANHIRNENIIDHNRYLRNNLNNDDIPSDDNNNDNINDNNDFNDSFINRSSFDNYLSNRYNNNNNNNNNNYNYDSNEMRLQRQKQIQKKRHEQLFQLLGDFRPFENYPSRHNRCWTKSTPRLVNMIGWPYMNLYRNNKAREESMRFKSRLIHKYNIVNINGICLDSNENESKNDNNNNNNSNSSVFSVAQNGIRGLINSGHSVANKSDNNEVIETRIHSNDTTDKTDNNNEESSSVGNKYRLCNARNMALNKINGWMAQLLYDECNKQVFLVIYECKESFGYEIVCIKDVTYIINEITSNMVNNGGISGVANNNVKIEDVLDMTRVRFNDNDVYVFCWSQEIKTLHQYKVLEEWNQEPSENDKCNYKIVEFNRFWDNYWVRSQVIDVDIIHDPDLIVILFGRWTGYYTFDRNDKDTPMTWFHAVAFCKAVGTYDTECHSFEAIGYDHTSFDNLVSAKQWSSPVDVSNTLQNEINSLRSKKDEEKNQNNNESKEQSDYKGNNGNYDENTADFCSLNRKINKLDDRLEFNDYSFYNQRFERPSHRFYNYIQCENEIISHHPSNSQFEFVRCAQDVMPGVLYCVSKVFGTFYTNRERNAVYHCDNLFPCMVSEIDVFEKDSHHSRKLCYMSYDESYGISGRLTMYVLNTFTNEHYMEYIIDKSDLAPLNEILEKYRDQTNVCFSIKSPANGMEIEMESKEESNNDQNNENNYNYNYNYNFIENMFVTDEDCEESRIHALICTNIYMYAYGNDFITKHYNSVFIDAIRLDNNNVDFIDSSESNNNYNDNNNNNNETDTNMVDIE